MNRSILALLIFSILFLVGCASPPAESSPVAPEGIALPSVCVDNSCVVVEVADTPAERQWGLMNRSKLAEDAGMIFVFEEMGIHSFWMKNTLIPLDVIWIGDNLHVMEVQSMSPCAQDPCPLYTPAWPAKYVLEVNAGWAEKKGIGPGELVTMYGILTE